MGGCTLRIARSPCAGSPHTAADRIAHTSVHARVGPRMTRTGSPAPTPACTTGTRGPPYNSRIGASCTFRTAYSGGPTPPHIRRSPVHSDSCQPARVDSPPRKGYRSLPGGARSGSRSRPRLPGAVPECLLRHSSLQVGPAGSPPPPGSPSWADRTPPARCTHRLGSPQVPASHPPKEYAGPALSHTPHPGVSSGPRLHLRASPGALRSRPRPAR